MTRLFTLLAVASLLCSEASGDVLNSAPDGFQIEIKQSSVMGPKQCCQLAIAEFSQWWDASHSYSQVAANLSMDLKAKAMLEKLPDGGFVRHMEILYYEPGKALRLGGGLGPLQAMGVNGALTIEFKASKSGTDILISYNVCGSSVSSLDKIAPAVDRVLSDQFKRLVSHCDGKVATQN